MSKENLYIKSLSNSRLNFHIQNLIPVRDEIVESLKPLIDLSDIPKPSLMAEMVVKELRERLHVITISRKDRRIGTYVYNNGIYVEGGDALRRLFYDVLNGLGVTTRISRYGSYISDFERILEDSTLADAEFDEHIVIYGDKAFDWRAFIHEDIYKDRPSLFDPSPEIMAVHRVPWRLDQDILMKDPPRAYDLFQSTTISREFEKWAGDKWGLLLEIVGYCLLAGDYPFNKAVMIYGEENTGKSTFLWLLSKLLGEDNVSNVPLQKLTSEVDRFSAFELYHKMANIYADIPKIGIRETGKFKMLTGGDRIMAERKFRDPITFMNYAKMIFSANELPEVHDTSGAFWRRWIVIRFENRFEQNPGYGKMLEEELLPREAGKVLSCGILAMKNVFLEGRFSFEGTAADYREEWLRKSNSIYAFLAVGKEEGWLEEGDGRKERGSDLYDLYVRWCEEEEREAVSRKAFTEEMNRLGYPSKRISGIGHYMRIRIVGEKLPDALRRGSLA